MNGVPAQAELGRDLLFAIPGEEPIEGLTKTGREFVERRHVRRG